MEDQQIEGNNKMKKIEDYTADELAKKIQAIKAEREKTANALKRYEEELGSRKQEVPLGVPLGVPLEDEMFSLFIGDYQFGFASEESMNVFYERIKLYAEVLQKLAKGEQCVCVCLGMFDIDISTLSRHLSVLKNAGIVADENDPVACEEIHAVVLEKAVCTRPEVHVLFVHCVEESACLLSEWNVNRKRRDSDAALRGER